MSNVRNLPGGNSVVHILDPYDLDRKRRFVLETRLSDPREVEVRTFHGDNLVGVQHYPIEVFTGLVAEIVRAYRHRRTERMTPNMLVTLPEFEDRDEWEI